MSDTSGSTLTVASYNIRAGLGTDLRRDAGRVLKSIAGLEADIVALQEADFRLGPRPTALPLQPLTEVTGLVPLPIADNGVSIGWHGITLLSRPELRHAAIHRIDLPGLEPRGAVIADFEAGLRVVGVHLGLLRRNRREQMTYIRGILSDMPHLPTIIMGDFNEWSQAKGFEPWNDHYTIIAPDRTYPARMPIGSLDRMAFTDDCKVEPLPVARIKGPQPSDHHPIRARVTLQ